MVIILAELLGGLLTLYADVPWIYTTPLSTFLDLPLFGLQSNSLYSLPGTQPKCSTKYVYLNHSITFTNTVQAVLPTQVLGTVNTVLSPKLFACWMGHVLTH